jgi:hypothetical protein
MTPGLRALLVLCLVAILGYGLLITHCSNLPLEPWPRWGSDRPPGSFSFLPTINKDGRRTKILPTSTTATDSRHENPQKLGSSFPPT